MEDFSSRSGFSTDSETSSKMTSLTDFLCDLQGAFIDSSSTNRICFKNWPSSLQKDFILFLLEKALETESASQKNINIQNLQAQLRNFYLFSKLTIEESQQYQEAIYTISNPKINPFLFKAEFDTIAYKTLSANLVSIFHLNCDTIGLICNFGLNYPNKFKLFAKKPLIYQPDFKFDPFYPLLQVNCVYKNIDSSNSLFQGKIFVSPPSHLIKIGGLIFLGFQQPMQMKSNPLFIEPTEYLKVGIYSQMKGKFGKVLAEISSSRFLSIKFFSKLKFNLQNFFMRSFGATQLSFGNLPKLENFFLGGKKFLFGVQTNKFSPKWANSHQGLNHFFSFDLGVDLPALKNLKLSLFNENAVGLTTKMNIENVDSLISYYFGVGVKAIIELEDYHPAFTFTMPVHHSNVDLNFFSLRLSSEDDY